MNDAKRKKLYRAVLYKDKSFEGVFFVGVKTTGIFCRPTCSARKPKFENCEFFDSAQEALFASYRPCLRCQPISLPGEVSSTITLLIDAIEKNPLHRWTDADFKKHGIDSSTARRNFKKHFGMTFVQYARARRMGMAMKDIRNGESIIDTQLNAGYESPSGFRDAFSKIMGAAPSKEGEHLRLLRASWIATPLGCMLAISDEEFLYLLEFGDRRGLEKEVERLRKRTKSAVVPGRTKITDLIEAELQRYFAGRLKTFKTPLFLLGSEFQKRAWNALMKIPFGQTRSYEEQAINSGNAKAFRAVANANGANQLAIVIPCHRIIHKSGDLGGYGGGVIRREWLLSHESKFA